MPRASNNLKLVADAAPTRRAPNFEGVPGELVDNEALDNLAFGTSKHRTSPYDALLDDLVRRTREAMGNGTRLPALRFPDQRALASLKARSKKKGLKLQFAIAEAVLYVRLSPSGLPASKDVDGQAENPFDAQILGVLKAGPLTNFKVAAKLRELGNVGADAPMCEVALSRMAKLGLVIKREGGTYGRRDTSAA